MGTKRAEEEAFKNLIEEDFRFVEPWLQTYLAEKYIGEDRELSSEETHQIAAQIARGDYQSEG